MHGYEKFKNDILKLTGLDLSLYKERQMKRRIESLIRRNKFDNYESYFTTLKSDKKIFDEFMNYLTINVSEFFRNPEQWHALVNDVAPNLLKNKRNLKIWSAACSTGEEPYTLVMALSRLMPLANIKILAVDIDKEALTKAKIGLYTKKSIENVPNDLKQKYFEPLGNGFKISDEIKRCVEYKAFNLLKDPYPRDYDLIVCRNVMIYFTDEAKDEMYHKFNGALRDGGILFVGSTEQIIAPSKYNFVSEETFFYTKK